MLISFCCQVFTVGCKKKITFCNCDYDCTTKYSRKISRNYNIPEIVITKRNT